MYRIIQILFVCLFFSCSSNAQDENIYLLFEDNKSEKCHISPYRDGRDKKEVITLTKKYIFYKKDIVFKICNQFFVFNPDINTKTQIPTKPDNIVNINYLTRMLEKDYLNIKKETLFKKIYVIEKNSDSTLVKYEVIWKDMHINDN